MIAAGLVVDEADQLIAKLAMFEDAVGHHAAEIAGAGDQDAAQPDARQPPPLQRFADELARQIAERDVADEEDAPDDARHFVGADITLRLRRVIRLEIQRGDNAEHDGENAADQHVEEVVDARAAAPQAIQALEVESQRHDQRHERQHVEVLLERRNAAGHRDQPGLEPQQVGQHERRHAQHGVGEDVKGDEEAVVALYHRCPAGALSVSSTTC